MKEYSLSLEKSIYMDFLRIFAALVVAAMHIFSFVFPSYLNKAYHYAHSAVVVFFVLSGFVIAYTTNVKNRGIRQYAVARLSRLYSILIPALIISLLIELFLKQFNPETYLIINRGNTLIRYLLSLFYINEIWFFSSAPPINAPLWSLSYEFSYYLLFGLYFFKNEIKYFNYILIFSIFVIGPKILLLMPIWLFGVLVFKTPQFKVSTRKCLFFSFLFLFFGIFFINFIPSLPKSIGTSPLFFSAGFITDFITGICFALSLWFFPNVKLFNVNTQRFYHYIRKISDLTFPIYILHFPLINLYKAFFKFSINNLFSFFMILIFVLSVAIVCGIFLEKFRNYYIIFFNKFFLTLNKLASKKAS